MKFFFNDNNRHYTLRFSWKPLLILEKAFYFLWWKDFNKVYNEKDFSNKEDVATLKEAIATTTETLEIIEQIFKDWLSPFVIYADDFKSNMMEWKK